MVTTLSYQKEEFLGNWQPPEDLLFLTCESAVVTMEHYSETDILDMLWISTKMGTRVAGKRMSGRPAPASTGIADKHPLVIELFEQEFCEMEAMDEARPLNIVAEEG